MKELIKYLNIVFIAFLFFFIAQLGLGQESKSKGILLLNQSALQIKFPTIDVTHDESFTFQNDLRISYEMSFWEPNHFGYLGKIILNDSLEFLLTYNTYSKIDTTYIQIVDNNAKSKINLPFCKKDLYRGNWFKYDFIFNVRDKKLSVKSESTINNIIDVPYLKLNKLDLIFGTKNSFGDFTSYAIKELKITTDKESANVKNYYWNFANVYDSKANDIINNKAAYLTNCRPLSDLNFKWRKLGEIKTSGYSHYSFDEKTGKIIVVDESKVNIYDLQSNETKEIIAKISVNDFRIEYDTLTQNLYSYHRGGGEVSVFDWKKEEWSKINNSLNSQHFYNHSLFINPLDSSLYMFGGYGWNAFHNEFQKYDFLSKKWNIKSVGGETIEPQRYISRWLSLKDSTLVYYGGYGNNSGEQSSGAIFYHDLWKLNLKTWNLRKIESLKLDSEVPPYRLVYYDKGKDEYYLFGTRNYFVDQDSTNWDDKVIDFLKSNGNSFSNFTLVNSIKINKELNILDAFYNKKTNEIIAIYWSGNKKNYTYEIQSIFFPMEQNVLTLAKNKDWELSSTYSFILLGLLIIIFPSIYIVVKKRKAKRGNVYTNNSIKIDEIENRIKYSIYLFGELQFFDKNYEDKTHLMSAKLTEMFMLIFFHTFNLTSNNGSSGITTEKLSTILWPNMVNGNLKNIRNVTINKLRGVLEEIGSLQIVFNNGHWKIEANDTQIDYIDILAFVKTCDINEIMNFLAIAKRGKILNNISYDWLDPIKFATDNVIIDCLVEHLCIIHDEKTILQIAETILSIDSVNEIGLKTKLQILNSEGKRTAVQNVYDNFIKEYENLYDEKYEKTLKDILS